MSVGMSKHPNHETGEAKVPKQLTSKYDHKAAATAAREELPLAGRQRVRTSPNDVRNAIDTCTAPKCGATTAANAILNKLGGGATSNNTTQQTNFHGPPGKCKPFRRAAIAPLGAISRAITPTMPMATGAANDC